LKKLECAGSQPGQGTLADLSPLKGLALTEVRVPNTHVADLLPLEGMPLEVLGIADTRVTDLAPLAAALQLHDLQGAPALIHKNTKILQSLPALKTINGISKAEMLKDAP
jgi:hypothetical protein